MRRFCVFPQEGITNYPGAEEVVIEGLKRSATVVGGAPRVCWTSLIIKSPLGVLPISSFFTQKSQQTLSQKFGALLRVVNSDAAALYGIRLDGAKSKVEG